jgi:hypothetical protein
MADGTGTKRFHWSSATASIVVTPRVLEGLARYLPPHTEGIRYALVTPSVVVTPKQWCTDAEGTGKARVTPRHLEHLARELARRCMRDLLTVIGSVLATVAAALRTFVVDLAPAPEPVVQAERVEPTVTTLVAALVVAPAGPPRS